LPSTAIPRLLSLARSIRLSAIPNCALSVAPDCASLSAVNRCGWCKFVCMRNCVGSASLYILHDTACSMIPPFAHENAYKHWARMYTFLLTTNDAHDDKVGLCQSRFVGGQNSCGLPRASAEWARKRRFHLPLTAATRPPIVVSVTVVLEKEKEDREIAGGRLTHGMGPMLTHASSTLFSLTMRQGVACSCLKSKCCTFFFKLNTVV
jgi:hypothetical protein